MLTRTQLIHAIAAGAHLSTRQAEDALMQYVTEQLARHQRAAPFEAPTAVPGPGTFPFPAEFPLEQADHPQEGMFERGTDHIGPRDLDRNQAEQPSLDTW